MQRGGADVTLMLDDIYNAKILGFAGNIPRIGRLPDMIGVRAGRIGMNDIGQSCIHYSFAKNAFRRR